MTLDQLRIFVAVAEFQHVTRAAQELGITQSGASAAIAALEARYGLELFHRVGRRIELTDAGQTFVPAARAVLARVAEARRDLAELSLLESGSLSLYASHTIANYWLPSRLGEFRVRYPGIQLQVKIGNSLQVAAAVADGSADLAFVDCSVDDPALEQVKLEGDRLVFINAGGLSAPAGKSVSLAELRTRPWVVRERGSGTRQSFEAAWRELSIDPARLNIVLELPSNEAVLTAVESGAGSSIVSSLVVRRTRFLPLDLGLAPRPFCVLRHRERNMSKAQQALLDMLQGKAPAAVPNAIFPRRTLTAQFQSRTRTPA